MKELYELDVALFGEERALGMWCFEDMFGELWDCSKEIYPGAEHPELAEFRRRYDAPSIWSKAPEWAFEIRRCKNSNRFCFFDKVVEGEALRGLWVGSKKSFHTCEDQQWSKAEVVARRQKTKRGETVLDDLMKPPHAINMRCITTPLPATTIYRTPDLYADATLLLQEPELVVWRDADGQLRHAPARDVLVNPDLDGLAAEVLSRMSGADIAPEHIAELRAQGLI